MLGECALALALDRDKLPELLRCADPGGGDGRCPAGPVPCGRDLAGIRAAQLTSAQSVIVHQAPFADYCPE